MGVAARQSEGRLPKSVADGRAYRVDMELIDAMRTAGSTREFRNEAVPDEIIYRVLDNARFAPNGGNRQGWRVIVVRDPVMRKSVRDLYLRSWVENFQPLFAHLPGNGTRPADRYAEHLHELPLQLIVLVERAALKTTVSAIDDSAIVPGASIYPFVQSVVLALRAEGLGTVLTAGLTPVAAEAKQLLNVPDEYVIVAHMGVGRPARPFPTRLKRKPVEEFASIDRFGGPVLKDAEGLRA